MKHTNKHLAIGAVAMILIAAGSAFAGWTSTQTGSVHVDTLGYVATFHPFKDWTYPDYVGNNISGYWDTELAGTEGTYNGTLDETYPGPGKRYTGTWGAQTTGGGGGIVVVAGTFALIKTRVGTNEYWSGTWQTNSPPFPAASGTMSGTFSTGPSTPSPYLIIYADIFDGKDTLNAFAEWKRKKGFDVEMIKLGAIDGVIYDTLPDVEAIRDYIRGWWNSVPSLPSYVLLVGDPIGVTYPDGEKAEWADPQHLPTHQYLMPDFYQRTSDYWFQLMDDEDDTADVALGRWCVNNDTDLNTMVTKTLAHENPDPALGWEPNRTLLVAHHNAWVYGDFNYDCADSSEVIRIMIEDWNIPEYEVYTAYGIVPPRLGGPDPEEGPNNDTIRGYLQGNHVTDGIGVLNFIGHGNVRDGWQTWNAWNTWGENLSNDTVYSFTQTHQGYPLVYNFCCEGAAIAYGGNRALCEAWTLHPDGGAAGALGASGMASCGGDEFSTPMIRRIFSAHFEDNLDCGWAIIEGGIELRKANTSLSEQGRTDRIHTTYWIGDPELDMWRRTPYDAEISGEVVEDQYLITVLRSSDDAPVPNTKVCMYAEGVCHLVAYTDVFGQVEFPYSPNPGTYHFTATNQFGPICIRPDTVSYNVQTGFMTSEIVEVEETPVWRLEAISPNPFNSSTIISYSVADAVPVELKVFDVSGREVRTLASGSHTPGHYELNWDGVDETGRQVSGGVYFIRMEAEGYQANRKITLIR